MSIVLMVCDPAESKFSLLPRAWQMAQAKQAVLHILDAVYVSGASQLGALEGEKLKNRMVKDREKEIRAAAKSVGMRIGQYAVDVRWSKDLGDEVLKTCKSVKPVMVVKRMTTRNKAVFHTPTDWRLIENSTAPLLLSPSKTFRKKPNILVALDLATSNKTKAKLNDKLIATANEMAKACGATLQVVCAVGISPVLADLDVIDVGKKKKELKQNVKILAEKLCNEYDIDKSQFIYKVGDPVKIINSASQKVKADMVVMGATGRKGIRGKLLGSTAELLLQNLYTDLLLLRP